MLSLPNAEFNMPNSIVTPCRKTSYYGRERLYGDRDLYAKNMRDSATIRLAD